MKKLAIFLALMLIPFSAFALDTISDSDLDSVTGQAGVSIFTNSIQIVRSNVTTTYTDANGTGNTTALGGASTAGEFSIVGDESITQVFFKGYDPINVDVVNMADAIAIIEHAAVSEDAGSVDVITGAGANYDLTELGESGVQITLPNQIVVYNLNATKTYYASGVAGIEADAAAGTTANQMIKITKTGGSTTYGLALAEGGFGNSSVAVGMYADFCDAMAWSNAGDESHDIGHADQLKILITAHE